MNINQKELVLLPYPFSDMERTKVRPALIVSNNVFNKQGNDCVVVPLTSLIKDQQYSVIIGQQDLCEGTLLKTSRIRADKLFSIEKNLIIMKIGIIDDKKFEEIRAEIIKLF
ncbi:type II toxin-antitoxin system PemK/MazF family toxin [Candidatus Pacearchaeota archaeon]|nr:type II toxin-antitoxin system PemK/MazF family toxin [Candidatus Pacearchaeota archaeon]